MVQGWLDSGELQFGEELEGWSNSSSRLEDYSTVNDAVITVSFFILYAGLLICTLHLFDHTRGEGVWSILWDFLK